MVLVYKAKQYKDMEFIPISLQTVSFFDMIKLIDRNVAQPSLVKHSINFSRCL